MATDEARSEAGPPGGFMEITSHKAWGRSIYSSAVIEVMVENELFLKLFDEIKNGPQDSPDLLDILHD